jgi:hypothetical protein
MFLGRDMQTKYDDNAVVRIHTSRRGEDYAIAFSTQPVQTQCPVQTQSLYRKIQGVTRLD